MQNDRDKKENQTEAPCYHLLALISTYAVAQCLAKLALQVTGSNPTIGTFFLCVFRFFLAACVSSIVPHYSTVF